MATTYLDITNEVLRELNEVPLTSANFTNATGRINYCSINSSLKFLGIFTEYRKHWVRE